MSHQILLFQAVNLENFSVCELITRGRTSVSIAKANLIELAVTPHGVIILYVGTKPGLIRICPLPRLLSILDDVEKHGLQILLLVVLKMVCSRSIRVHLHLNLLLTLVLPVHLIVHSEEAENRYYIGYYKVEAL